MSKLDFKSGSLVTLRGRPWVVQPSEDPEVLLLKPLGGSDEELTGIFLPLAFESDLPQSHDFVKPSTRDLGNDFYSARLLYNASRISFRNASGPFRCLGKLSFRPRSYQMVPLIMALRQEVVRLLIADDVGVGKTIEALLIAKELYERKEIKRFAIICLPHLCDQWQEELKSKFGIEAVIIRSGTVTALERQIRTSENIFRAFSFQIISIDYIKSGEKRQIFLNHCPEFIIVDEAHSCARPLGAIKSQQLRHFLLHDIAKRDHQHLVMLTATPHSGKEVEFLSLLGLLKTEFERTPLNDTSPTQRKELSKHFVQRRRKDVLKWMDEDTRFPDRISIEKPYLISTAYADIFNHVLSYAREIVGQSGGDRRKQRYSFWEALALLRGVMSSPAAGVTMLNNKAQKKKLALGEDDQEYQADLGSGEEESNPDSQSVLDPTDQAEDTLPLAVIGRIAATPESEAKRLKSYAKELESIGNVEHDLKAKAALDEVRVLLEEGYNPIVFCRYIQTAIYLGGILGSALRGKKYSNLMIEVVTSEADDELRKQKIGELHKSDRRLLIATDCLSEGINLQEGFDAVIHYDLPWNPNRLEQREGRIDRFGQQSRNVKVVLLYGNTNPIDGVVLEVLLRKAREIRTSLGISVPFPENSESVMEAVTNAILLKPNAVVYSASKQLSLLDDEVISQQLHVQNVFEQAAEREKLTRSVFAQNAIKAEEIEKDLKEVDEAIGDIQAVEDFVTSAIRLLGGQADQSMEGYTIFTTNLSSRIKTYLTDKPEIKVSFKSPTPAGYMYLGRNHPFTEQLAQFILNQALEAQPHCAARAAVVRTKDVITKTILFQLRVRNVIREQQTAKEIVTEEMWLWGYEGTPDKGRFLSKEDAMRLLLHARSSQNIDRQEQAHWLDKETAWIKDEALFRKHTDPVALQRANHLVESHTRFKKLISGSSYRVVEPILPMDVLGVYILLPVI